MSAWMVDVLITRWMNIDVFTKNMTKFWKLLPSRVYNIGF